MARDSSDREILKQQKENRKGQGREALMDEALKRYKIAVAGGASENESIFLQIEAKERI